MPFILTAKDGRLFLDEEMMDQVSPFLECPAGISKGNLLMKASLKNILTICDHIVYRFIRSGGIFLLDSKWLQPITSGVVRKYGKVGNLMSNKSVSDNINFQNRVTRGWCYLLSGALHRFFYKDFDLYCNSTPLINNDTHWWLQDRKNNIIDLTADQYLLNDIYTCREKGKIHAPLGKPYSLKTRDLAFTIANDLCREGVDIRKIKVDEYELH